MGKTYIIAEAGVNHNGSLEMAEKLVKKAYEAGADAVKFQTFKAEKLVTRKAIKADYQKRLTDDGDNQWEMLKKLELSPENHHHLISLCQKLGIEFLSTPFDGESLIFLSRELQLPRIKIPSGEITNLPFLVQIAREGKPVILSTGMSDLGEVENALSALAWGFLNPDGIPSRGIASLKEAYSTPKGQEILLKRVTLLHCTTEYPAPLDEVNLKAMKTLRKSFGLPAGYSDHTQGITIPIAAVAMGAVLIEKHFTLDKNLPGPDHQASLDPEELKAMVHGIREVEKALGQPIKMASPSELKNRDIARKSLVTLMPIKKGDNFSTENLGIKRPGHASPPLRLWDLLGTPAEKDYEEDETLK